MLRLLTRTLCLVALTSITSLAEAQIVRIGPFGGVRVRAPFVAVDVMPYGGGTRVRAPLTAVDTGAYRYPYSGYRIPEYRGPEYRGVPGYRPSPAYPVPAYPDGGYVYPRPDDRRAARPPAPGSMRNSLLSAAQQLKRSLSARRDDSEVWLGYLQPDRIIAALERGESLDSLSPLLRNYDGVVANAGLTSISNARGFAETRRWLRALVEARPGVSSEQEASPADDSDAEPAPEPPPKAEPKSEEIPLPPVPTPL